MSTREYFEGVYRSARMHGYGPSVLASSFEFINDYPMPRMHGRLRQPLPERPIGGGIYFPSESRIEEPKDSEFVKIIRSIEKLPKLKLQPLFKHDSEEETKITFPKENFKRSVDWDEVWKRNNEALEASIDKWDKMWDKENEAYEKEFDRKYKDLSYSIF